MYFLCISLFIFIISFALPSIIIVIQLDVNSCISIFITCLSQYLFNFSQFWQLTYPRFFEIAWNICTNVSSYPISRIFLPLFPRYIFLIEKEYFLRHCCAYLSKIPMKLISILDSNLPRMYAFPPNIRPTSSEVLFSIRVLSSLV